MPATEETWRSSKLLHVIFGVSSVALFLATLWMLAKDHDREWKHYQRSFQHLDEWSAQARAAEADTAKYAEQREELQAALDAVRAELPNAKEVQDFLALARTAGLEKEAAAADKLWQTIEENPSEDAAENTERRTSFVAALQAIVARAKFLEDNLSRELKFANADLDVARSNYKLGVDNALPPQQLADLETAFGQVEERVEAARLAYQEGRHQREQLQQGVGRMQAAETAAAKALADHESTLAQLQQTVVDRAHLADNTLLTLPIIDPFGGPFKIQQIWLPQLTLNNNFKEVARFDRCTTCHQGIDRTAAGSAVAPGYEQSHQVTLPLATPEESLGLPGGLVDPAQGDALLREHYGLQLSPHGVFDSSVMIMVAWPQTPAAMAGLQSGDVIEMINDVQILDIDLAYSYLLQNVEWGLPLQVRVRRGVPEPFSSHPRLDLFVGSTSPHKMQEMGCTICHEGQGSATSFKWASHSPSTPAEQEDWADEHGWFNNHHWIYPMRPERFEESSCLKCHHQVVELLPSERFPDPPAPKLMQGYDTVRQFGCFGCHEVVGWDGPQRRIGPDLRNEPAYAAAAQQLLIDAGLNDEEREWAEMVAAHPENTAARQRLAESIRADAALATAEDAEESPRLTAASHALATVVGADDPIPGEFRRVGPSLRHLSSKVELPFLYRWVEKPAGFRPSTKMPQFFGLWDHLSDVPKTDGSGQVVLDEHGQPEMATSPARLESERFEPVEIRAISEYLLHFSQPFEYLTPPEGDIAPASAERGKLAFEVRGCLACHQQGESFPEASATQGPDLSNLGSKLVGERGQQWLYSWVREPNRYHARTVMPNLFLTVEAQADGTLVDPAADITEYLLSQQEWQAEPLPELDREALTDLAEMYLRGAFSQTQAARYAEEGIPQDLDSELSGDERLLLSDGPIEDDQRLLYVGRRTIARLGCAGCHDIPGFEDAKPIGTGLNDWGRKEASKLAFEQILSYPHLPGNGHLEAHGHGDAADHAHGHGPSLEGLDQDTGYYVESLLAHERTGFIWQKLREPRSYDYRQAENKPYTDRLRMPQFTFSLDEAENAARRESVITFVLGLVAEPPAARYVYQPGPQQRAIVQGQKVLERFNCAGCHTLNMERWQVEYDPEEFESPGDFTDYAFLAPHFTPDALAQSQRVDRRGRGHALLTGVPNPQVGEDDDENPLYFFGLWKPTAINGEVWTPGGLEVPVPEAAIERKLPPVGGDFARLVYPTVLAQGMQSNPNLKPNDVWGWVPPPLLGEGAKVQPQWLHDFLLDPFEIRPAAVLRMPKFNLSSAEATALVEYFAAVDGLTKPYEYDERTRSAHLAEAEATYRAALVEAGVEGDPATSVSAQLRLDAALRLITDNNYCVKCHLVGDFAPQGSRAAMAPRLDRVHQRLRPEFLRRWIANPVRVLPYTGMPVNFPADKPAAQELYMGDSLQQIDGVVDLLLNYDRLMKERQSIQAMVKPAPPADEAAPAGDEEAAAVDEPQTGSESAGSGN